MLGRDCTALNHKKYADRRNVMLETISHGYE